jgi:hypothetical protein
LALSFFLFFFSFFLIFCARHFGAKASGQEESQKEKGRGLELQNLID